MSQLVTAEKTDEEAVIDAERGGLPYDQVSRSYHRAQ